MKNVLLGAVAVGVGYLVYCQFKNKKCGCSGSKPASSSTPAASETTLGPGNVMAEPPVAGGAAPALAANGGDGFGKRYF